MNVLGGIEDLLYLSRRIEEEHILKTQDKEDQLWRLGRLTKAHSQDQLKDNSSVRSDAQGWASGQFRDGPVVRLVFSVGPVVKYQDVQIQRDRCEPEELEEFEDAKLDKIAYKLGNQDKSRLYYIKIYKIYLNHFESNNI